MANYRGLVTGRSTGLVSASRLRRDVQQASAQTRSYSVCVPTWPATVPSSRPLPRPVPSFGPNRDRKTRLPLVSQLRRVKRRQLNTLVRLSLFAAQHTMIWGGLDLPPGWAYTSTGRRDSLTTR